MIVRTEGLRDLMLALREINIEVYGAVRDGLEKAGEVVADDAKTRFSKYDKRTAENFEVRVRPAAEASVFIGQRLRKTTGLRPDYGALQVTKALLPARDEKLEEAALIVEGEVIGLLRSHGF